MKKEMIKEPVKGAGKYKQTEIGIIPNDWHLPILSSICAKLNVGFVGICEPFFTDEFNGVLLIRTGNLQGNRLVLDGSKYVTKDFHIRNLKSKVTSGDILIARHGSSGNAVLVPDKIVEANTLNIVILRADVAKVSKLFLSHIINSNYVKTQAINLTAGSTQGVINTSAIATLQIPLPPTLAEQTAIATALSDADDLISNLEKLIEKKRNIKQGAMQQLLSPTTPDGKLKKGWTVKKLGDFLDYEQPTEYLVSDTEYNNFNQTPVLTAGKTFILGYTNEEHGIFKELPVIIFDDFTTAIKYVDFPFKAKSSAMKMLIPKNESVNLRFVFELMLQIKYTPGDHKRHWIGEFQQMEIMVPIKEEHQYEIANILGNMDREITLLEEKLSKSKMIKQGMMQELLTGKIRLV
jgi:type I restriction enzyme S subunit